MFCLAMNFSEDTFFQSNLLANIKDLGKTFDNWDFDKEIWGFQRGRLTLYEYKMG